MFVLILFRNAPQSQRRWVLVGGSACVVPVYHPHRLLDIEAIGRVWMDKHLKGLRVSTVGE